MTELVTAEQRASYGVGRQLAEQLMANPFEDMSPEAVVAGVQDALAGQPSAVNPQELQAAYEEINKKMNAIKVAAAAEGAKAGEAFLKENAEKPGVTVLESGLQYEVITEGDGAKPTKESTVRTHYHGTSIDGKVFDSSVDRGQPAEFPVGGVIAGWTEALQLMSVGSKWRLFIPHQLAYGERGAGGAIPPYAALVFEVELLDIVS